MLVEKKLVSVILPAFNSAEYIEDAVACILGQSYRDLELIVMYEKSDDDTLEKILALQKNDQRIRISFCKNKGLAEALNEGIDLARGQFVARMDADDLCHTERLSKQIELLEKSGADVCGCHYQVISKSGKIKFVTMVALNHFLIGVSMTSGVPFAHGSALIRKSYLDKNKVRYKKGFPAEDYDLWLTVYGEGGKFINYDEILYSYRDIESSLSKINKKNVKKCTIKLKNNFIKKNYHSINNKIELYINQYDDLNFMERAFIAAFIFNSLFIKFSFKSLVMLIKLLKKLKLKELLIASHFMFYRWVR